MKRNHIHYITVRAHPGPKPSHKTFKDIPIHERNDVFSEQELRETCEYINKMASKNQHIPVSIEHTYINKEMYPNQKEVPQLKTGYVLSAFMNPKDNNCLLANLAFETDNPYDIFALKCIKDGYLKEVSINHTAYTYKGPITNTEIVKNFDPRKKVFEISLCQKGRREDTVIFNTDTISERTSHAASMINIQNKINVDDVTNTINEFDLNDLSMIISEISK